MYIHTNSIMIHENDLSKVDYNIIINYFVEGKYDQEIYDQYESVVLTSSVTIYDYQIPKINYFKYNNANKYLSYQVRYGDKYYKDIKFDIDNNKFIDMVRGDIVGNVNLSSCNVTDMSKLKILCYRNDDHFFIGEYPVVDNKYFIPNLDVNTRYDIVLVDESRTIEQQVSSYRKPTAHVVDEINVANITNLRREKIGGGDYLLWDVYKDIKTEVDYYNVYYLGINGDENILLDERIFENYFKFAETEIIINGKYQVECIYKGKISKSNIYTFESQLLEVIINDGTYVPPLGDNIEIIINEV